MQEAARFENC